jgi:hypothetical protein
MVGRMHVRQVTMSNIGPGVSLEFLDQAAQAHEQRIASGFGEDGQVGGAFSETNPPPGLRFGGYLKGATGIKWVEATAPPRRQQPSASTLNRMCVHPGRRSQ